MTRRAKDPLMAINSDTKPLTPEELPTDPETTLAALNAEDGGAEALPDSAEHEQIMEELRHAKTEQAVSARRNRKLTLDKVTFGITGAIAVAFAIGLFVGLRMPSAPLPAQALLVDVMDP